MKKLFVIMVTYRRFEAFKQTMESLLPTLPEGSAVRVVYNQDGKTEDDDKYYEYLSELPDNVRVMFPGDNRGWAAAINEGLSLYKEWREYEYVLESNNDVTYERDWFIKASTIMSWHREIGLLGLWAHPHHGVRMTLESGVVIKDNMPATAWLFRSQDLNNLFPFKERGATKMRGGNGEDTDVVLRVQAKDKWVAWPGVDLAHHIDGYDISDLGKPNQAYD